MLLVLKNFMQNDLLQVKWCKMGLFKWISFDAIYNNSLHSF